MSTYKCACTDTSSWCARDNCERIWVTREGERIPVSKMELRHLINTAHMLERFAERKANAMQLHEVLYNFPTGMRGEMAEYYAEQEFSARVEAMTPETFVPPIYWHIVDEIQRKWPKTASIHEATPSFIPKLKR